MYTVKAIKKDTNEWINGYLWNGNNEAYIIPYNLGIGYEKNTITAHAYEIRKETICRNTTVDAYWVDKKDDIIKFEYADAIYTGKVIYDLGAFMIEIIDAEDEFVTFYDLQSNHSSNIINAQIVGNLYDVIH